ncbi:MAG: hypothetical protein HN644_12550 [Rhodospirillales bacterium]|jgi:hypothetical protein|nr:hypothetical protein [Rhodospirillales bacterium]MBT4041840.1 hypothetical protein [Rhodospirillales bacterium]MBT4626822.1 hypothetical protein [Rhodospirillales bacterium]MBT5351623.1 hypothetical protein [Rhodospirillales bacterium]MBT5521195.1 hypothetical protein [Rhodospirillales bacterium]
MHTPEDDNFDWSVQFHELDAPASTFKKLQPFVELWNSKRIGTGLPAWKNFELEDFQEWYGWVAVFDIVATSPFDCLARLWGMEITDTFGYEMTGKSPRDIGPEGGQFQSDMDFKEKLYKERLIGSTSGSIFWDDRKYIHIEEVFLPLATDGHKIDKLMCLTQRTD